MTRTGRHPAGLVWFYLDLAMSVALLAVGLWHPSLPFDLVAVAWAYLAARQWRLLSRSRGR